MNEPTCITHISSPTTSGLSLSDTHILSHEFPSIYNDWQKANKAVRFVIERYQVQRMNDCNI